MESKCQGDSYESMNDDNSLPSAQENNELPDEIVLKADYSCYCKVCHCTLSRIKDAIQHASGKRHKKAHQTMNEKGVKRTASEDSDSNEKKIRTNETMKDEEAKKLLSEVFDETFHDGVVALSDNYYCKVCRCMIGNNRKNVNQHKDGKSHKMALDKFKKSLLSGDIGDNIPIEDPNQPFEGDGYIEKKKNAKRKTSYYCKICDFRTKDREVITEHMRGDQHQENICIAKENERTAQQGSYLRGRNEDYHRAESGMHPEERYNELEMERLGPWQSKPYFNRGDPSFYGNYQNNINEGMQNHNYENFIPPMNPNALMLQQVRASQQPDALFPQSNQASVPFMLRPPYISDQFMPHPQHISHQFMPHPHQTTLPFVPPQPVQVPFVPQPQMTPFPDPLQFQQSQVPTITQSQQDVLPAMSVLQSAQKLESAAPNQTSSSVSNDLFGFITNESDAEVVMDVINSLLQTYLKYRLQALPGSFMKLLRKSSKTEENVTRINKLATGKTTKQIFINTQSQKNKVQLKRTAADQRLSPSVLYERRSEKYSENRSSKSIPINELSYSEDIYNRSRDNKFNNSCNIPKTANQTSNTYDQRSYIEDQIRKAISLKGMVEGQQSSNRDVRFPNNMRQSDRSETLKQIRDFSNDDYSQGLKTKILPQNIRKTDSSSTDFSNRYRSSRIDNKSSATVFTERNRGFRGEDSCTRNSYQDAQSVIDLFRKYRSSSNYSHN